MKPKFALVALLFALLALFAVPANAQIAASPNTTPLFYSHTVANAKYYTNSQTDTLPQPTAMGVANTLKLGGVSEFTLCTQVVDTVSMDIYVDQRIIGDTVWTNIKADSLSSTTVNKAFRLTVIKSPTVSLMTGLNVEIRIRNAFRSAAVYPSYTFAGIANKYTQRIYFK